MLPAGDASAVGVVDKMFSEIDRVLKFGGRYVCISLLQPHILQHLVNSYSNLVNKRLYPGSMLKITIFAIRAIFGQKLAAALQTCVMICF
jgi:ubiquinone/menaquinone biosynthesis C-methylase UbiE